MGDVAHKYIYIYEEHVCLMSLRSLMLEMNYEG